MECAPENLHALSQAVILYTIFRARFQQVVTVETARALGRWDISSMEDTATGSTPVRKATHGMATGRKWGFIGAGKMATALIRGMLRTRGGRAADLVASDPLAAARTALAAETGIEVFEANPPVVERSDVLVLAVKPRAMREVLPELRPLVGPGHLVISIAAGVPIATLVEGLGRIAGSSG